MQTQSVRLLNRQLTQNVFRVHIYAEGFCDGKTLSEDNLCKTVGIKIKRTDSVLKVNGIGLLIGESYDIPENRYSPFFAADDTDAENLAIYDNGDVAVSKKGNDIWIGVPCTNSEIMRKIFEMCGAHIYCRTGDPIIAGAGIVAINSANGGEREITLKNGKTVTVALSPFTTAVFNDKTGERLL